MTAPDPLIARRNQIPRGKSTETLTVYQVLSRRNYGFSGVSWVCVNAGSK